MTNKQFAKLAQNLVLDLPGYVIKGQLMIAAPLRHMVRGLCFESSSHDKDAFYIWMFYMALYVPADSIHFTFGDRLTDSTGSDRWDATMPKLVEELRAAVQQQAIPFLAGIDTPLEIAQRAAVSCDLTDPHVCEAMALSFARAGQIDRAISALQELIKVMRLDFDWERELHARAKAFLLLLQNDADKAQKQLDAWEAETIRDCKLETFL